MCERRLGHGKPHHTCPYPSVFLLYTPSATRAHDHELIGTPDQSARKSGSGTQSRIVSVIRWGRNPTTTS
jgi:hypothetical protein